MKKKQKTTFEFGITLKSINDLRRLLNRYHKDFNINDTITLDFDDVNVVFGIGNKL